MNPVRVELVQFVERFQLVKANVLFDYSTKLLNESILNKIGFLQRLRPLQDYSVFSLTTYAF